MLKSVDFWLLTILAIVIAYFVGNSGSSEILTSVNPIVQQKHSNIYPEIPPVTLDTVGSTLKFLQDAQSATFVELDEKIIPQLSACKRSSNGCPKSYYELQIQKLIANLIIKYLDIRRTQPANTPNNMSKARKDALFFVNASDSVAQQMLESIATLPSSPPNNPSVREEYYKKIYRLHEDTDFVLGQVSQLSEPLMAWREKSDKEWEEKQAREPTINCSQALSDAASRFCIGGALEVMSSSNARGFLERANDIMRSNAGCSTNWTSLAEANRSKGRLLTLRLSSGHIMPSSNGVDWLFKACAP